MDDDSQQKCKSKKFQRYHRIFGAEIYSSREIDRNNRVYALLHSVCIQYYE